MGQSPVACLSRHGPDDGAGGNLDGLACGNDLSDIQFQGNPDGLRFRPDTEGKGRNSGLLPHALPIRREGIDVPVPGRGEVEFPISPGILDPQKELQAGFFPEAVLPSRKLSRRGNREFRQIAQQRVTDGQRVPESPDRPGDLDIGPIFLSRKRYEGKVPEIQRMSRGTGSRARPVTFRTAGAGSAAL